MEWPERSRVREREYVAWDFSFLRDLMRLARPHHWVKNVMVLLPVVFARKVDDLHAWAAAVVAAAAFSLASSAVYAVNDVRDRKSDSLNPLKRHRPVASERISPSAAIAFSFACAGVSVLIGLQVSAFIVAIIGFYLCLQVAYTLDLKHRPIADVICIAIGFVLRALAGTAAIGVQASSWLIICAFTLCMFIGFCKRWNEAAALAGHASAVACRKTLGAYNREFLTYLMTFSAGQAVLAYLLYASSAHTIERFGTNAFVYTLPIVIYGICRLAMVSMQARYSDPVTAFLRDKPLLITGLLWIISATIIVVWGERFDCVICTVS